MKATRPGTDEDDDVEAGTSHTLLASEPRPSTHPKQKTPAPAKAEQIPAGAILGGHYRVVRRLGGGAIGHVYEAINTFTTRRVAVKVLREDFVDDKEVAQRFLIEAQSATRVAHPHIVDILDMGRDETSGHLYLVQEFLEGRDLHEHLAQKGRLTVPEAQAVLLPVMHALVAAHEKGVLHRDLKPENVFLVQSPDGHTVPKVIDFGLARNETDGAARVTRVGSLMGTPFYMSPEQARGESTVDAQTDVWAIGVLWYEVLTGVVPFDGSNLHQVLHAIFMKDPARIEALARDVPTAVADVIHHALVRDRKERYASMSEFLDALYAVLPDEPAAAPASLRSSRPGRGSQPAPMRRSGPSITPPRASQAPQATSSQDYRLPTIPPPGSLPGSLTIPPPGPATLTPAAAPASDARRLRALSVLLGMAIVALVVVAAIAIQALRASDAPRPALQATPEAPHDASAAVATDASTAPTAADAAAALAADATAATAATDDAGAASEEPSAHGSHHRRHGRDDDGSHRGHRGRH